MPYEVENSPIGAQLAGGLAAAMTGYQQAHQQKLENQMAQQQANEEAQQAALQRQISQQQLAAGAEDAAQRQAWKTQQAGLKYPPGWDKMTVDQKIDYLHVRQNEALKTQNKDLFNSTQQEIDSLQLGQTREASAGLNVMKTKLTEAQANNARGLFQQQVLLADKRYKGQVDVARINAEYRRLGGGRAGNTLEQEQRIMLQSLNAGARQGTAAYNALQNQIYNTREALHLANPNNPQYPEPSSPDYQTATTYFGGPDGGTYSMQPNPQNPTQPIILRVDVGAPPPSTTTTASSVKNTNADSKRAQGGYVIGQVYGGMKYLGGDPNKQSNWKKVAAPKAAPQGQGWLDRILHPPNLGNP